MLAPAKGPKAGGTELRIFGEHFVDTGQIRVRFATSTFEVVVPGVVTQYVASRGVDVAVQVLDKLSWRVKCVCISCDCKMIFWFGYVRSGVLQCVTPKCPVDGEETVVVVAALDWAIADGAMYIVSHKSKLKPVFVYE
ncbi:hypothetical protein DYB37_006088 [Aphanomyces astaci]|uniref:IPT/TIG domain-containing protein n=1 Tax=Aphanomyces astaci TaxID=112090 RepID=A0A397EVC3_APHAT|nr:hypothetical protein DYB35_000013 [Aphanomyces astaci]RHZ07236.1 hypothetical protein DYB31_008440 [Aphanomyces astaci]RHZ33088.1 hypothetical protein DYB37_006088 [Aphanomyces astaci]RHZ40930.1 hypothetical protein DYB26_006938 [Aphanomyces astaci]